jgi:7,8-dihydropterin-6-yl-methyl-4-(beta-D-ribofuranosyl)aminobenzene 5'-phosphate synthase
VVDGLEKRILFDTGTKGSILLHNLKELDIDPASFDLIVISHRHWDHVGGLGTILLQNKDAQIVVLESSPEELLSTVRSLGGKILPVTGPTELCPGARTGGEMGGSIKEQALVLDAAEGLVVLTGCSHPGICSMLKEIKEREGRGIALVLGGFHLLQKSDGEMEKVLQQFKTLGVRSVGPAHCTGDEQIEMFRDTYGERFTDVGVGTVVSLPTDSTSR